MNKGSNAPKKPTRPPMPTIKQMKPAIYKPVEEKREPTYEEVIEYCNKRCLMIITTELYEKMARAYIQQETIIRCNNCKYEKKCNRAVYTDSIGGGYIHCPIEYCSNGKRKG